MANNYYELQYTGNKVIQWKNFTDTSTPLSAANLQKSHQAIDDMDQAVNAGFKSVDNTKLDKTLAGSMLTGVTYNDETGQMVFKHYDNSIPDITFNTNLQKLVVNFSYDPQTQKLLLKQADGEVVPVDLSAFVANPDLKNSDEISWTINQDGSISANIINGSITDEKLESGFLADVTEQADAAEQSAEDADYYSKLSKSYANGTSNLQDRPNENVDNSKYFKEESEAWAVGKKNGSDVPSSASQYHNNSKYWAGQSKSDGEAWAKGTRNGVDVPSTDETYHNSAKYWAEQAGQSSGAVDMRGATSSAAGAHGLVPAPAAGDNEKFLRGDGSWQEASASDFTGATASANGKHGLVPQPLIADKDKFLKGDGSWGKPAGHEYDVEASTNKEAMVLKEDNVAKTTLPLPSTFVGTQAEWDALSATNKAKYRIVHFTDDGPLSNNVSDSVVNFTSSDTTDADATSWTSVSTLTTGGSLTSLFAKVSQMFKNVRYLNKVTRSQLYLSDLSSQGLTLIWRDNITACNNISKSGNVYVLHASLSINGTYTGTSDWKLLYTDELNYLSKINSNNEFWMAENGVLTAKYLYIENGRTFSDFALNIETMFVG